MDLITPRGLSYSRVSDVQVALGICRALFATKSEMTYVPREQTVNALGTYPSVSALTEPLR